MSKKGSEKVPKELREGVAKGLWQIRLPRTLYDNINKTRICLFTNLGRKMIC